MANALGPNPDASMFIPNRPKQLDEKLNVLLEEMKSLKRQLDEVMSQKTKLILQVEKDFKRKKYKKETQSF